MQKVKVWDAMVRIFHWSLAAGFLADALFVDDDSALHNQIGYVVLGLIGFRIVWGIIGPRHARFSDFPPSLQATLGHLTDIATGRARQHLGHSPLGALMIYNLLISIALICLTGVMMTQAGGSGAEQIEDLHEGLVVWAGFSVFVHIVAIVVESLRTKSNLPLSMITGFKSMPAPSGQNPGGADT